MTAFDKRHEEMADAALMRAMETESPGVIRLDLKKMSREVAAALAATEAELVARMMDWAESQPPFVRDTGRDFLTAFARGNNIPIVEDKETAG